LKIVIVGAGEVGFNIASHLAIENKDVVVVDNNLAAIRYVSDNIDVQVLKRVRKQPGCFEGSRHQRGGYPPCGYR
jgi:trk system potassium uptake protein TrkA